MPTLPSSLPPSPKLRPPTTQGSGGRGAPPQSTFGRELKKSQFKRVKPVAEDQKGIYLVLQDATYTFMVKTSAGFYLDFIQTLLSLVACILYVAETYMEMDGPYPESIITVSLILSGESLDRSFCSLQ